MITTKGKTMNRLTELKQKSPSFGLRNRRSNETKTRSRRVILLLLLLSTLFWAAGCEDYYSSSPGYYDTAVASSPKARVWMPAFTGSRLPGRWVEVDGSPGSYYEANPADFLDHDRRYYRGPGYSYGRVYYVWEPGYWAFRTGVSPSRGPGFGGNNGALPNPGQLLWIHGRYIAQGY
jgi:hypothetical protein